MKTPAEPARFASEAARALWFRQRDALAQCTFPAGSSAKRFLRSIIGQMVLFGFTWALFHHFMGGIRHALWDAGIGFDAPQREWLAQGTWIAGLALTVLVWAIAFVIR